MPGQGFQFSPAGFTPLDAPVPQAGTGFAPSASPVSVPIAEAPGVVAQSGEPPVCTRATLVRSQPTPLRPRDIVHAARARIRELKTEIRRMSGLKKELTELERLVRAAKEKPRAQVRAIDSARRTG